MNKNIDFGMPNPSFTDAFDFEVFILCGGKSRRMKQDKSRLLLGKETLVQRAVNSAFTINPQSVSLVGENSDKSLQISCVADIFAERGALGGIHAALSAAKCNRVLILACDYPFLSKDLLEFLRDKTFSLGNDFDIVIPVQKDGRAQPLCAFYHVNCLHVIEKILSESQKTPPVRTLIDLHKTYRIEFSEFADLPDAENFFLNLNTPEDFAYAKMLKGKM